MKLKFLAFAAAAFLAACSFGSEPAKAQPTPVACQWNYQMLPPDSANQTATATYCGNVVVNGTIISPDANTVSTIAALEALDISKFPTGAAFNVLGYNTIGDGGGGIFYLNLSSAATSDSCTIFPTSATGRWLRNLSGLMLSPYHCGAVGNGTINDSTAVQAWFTYMGVHGGSFYCASGNYRLNTNVTVTMTTGNPVIKIYGAGSNVIFGSSNDGAGACTFEGRAGSGPIIAVTQSGSGYGFTVAGIAINDKTGTAPYLLKLIDVSGPKLSDNRFEGSTTAQVYCTGSVSACSGWYSSNNLFSDAGGDAWLSDIPSVDDFTSIHDQLGGMQGDGFHFAGDGYAHRAVNFYGLQANNFVGNAIDVEGCFNGGTMSGLKLEFDTGDGHVNEPFIRFRHGTVFCTDTYGYSIEEPFLEIGEAPGFTLTTAIAVSQNQNFRITGGYLGQGVGVTTTNFVGADASMAASTTLLNGSSEVYAPYVSGGTLTNVYNDNNGNTYGAGHTFIANSRDFVTNAAQGNAANYTGASGGYSVVQRSGTTQAYIGLAKAIFGASYSADDFAIGANQKAWIAGTQVGIIGPLVTSSYTIATLPAGTTGARAQITDNNVACVFGAAPVAGGTTVCPVFYNSAAWVIQ